MLALPKRYCYTTTLKYYLTTNFSTVGKRPEIEKSCDRLDLSFENTKEAFKSKTNLELSRGLLVLRLCSYEKLVEHNQKLLKVLRKITGRRLFSLILQSSFYGHFVAGENQEQARLTIQRLKQFGVKSILDYSVEADISQEEAEQKTDHNGTLTPQPHEHQQKEINQQDQDQQQDEGRYKAYRKFADRRQDVVSARTYFYEGEPECDRNADIFRSSIDAVAANTNGDGFMAIKLTALGRPKLLMQLSHVIDKTQQFYRALAGCSWQDLVESKLDGDRFLQRLNELGIKTDSSDVQEWLRTLDFNSNGFIDILEWSRLLDNNFRIGQTFHILDLKTGQLKPLIDDLSDQEERQYVNMMTRLKGVAEHAKSNGVRIMIDAEQTYFQPAINRLTLELMRRYNKDSGCVFNTYQAYLKNTLNTVRIDMHMARREGFHFGAKLVRGAYMHQERSRANEVGYEDPINPSFQATSAMYDRVFDAIIDEHELRGHGQVSIMCATHNEDSVRHIVETMKSKAINPDQKVVCFAQLYGMCDQVSFSLGQAGFSIYKYLPYGPVEEVLPYLSRRAIENGGILGKANKDRRLMWTELKRRLVQGHWWHTPKAQSVLP